MASRIYGDRVVWNDERNGGGDIYMYDLKANKEYPICTVKEDQYHPAIYEDRIVWIDDRPENPGIYMFEIKD